MIESGSRSLIEGALPHFRNMWGADVEIDLISCYAGLPNGLNAESRVFRVTDYRSPEARRVLVRVLRERNYSFAGMICSAEPVMTKWKWMLAFKVPAKFLVLNENGDFFWVHRDNWPTIRRFALVRAGLAGEGSLRTLGRLVVFPFSVMFLLLYAGWVHMRRMVRLRFGPGRHPLT